MSDNIRNFEMIIRSKQDRLRLLVPEDVKNKDQYLQRLAVECVSMFRKNPKLARCDKMSVFLGVMQGARHGLNFADGECSLVPFGGQAVFVLGAPGIIRILLRTGVFKKIKYGTVFDNDHFEFMEGSGDTDFVKHRKALKNRGDVLAGWASADTHDGTTHVYIMDHDELMKIRSSSPGFKPVDKSNPYNKWPEEMHGKAPLKRLFKRLQHDSESIREAGKALSMDDSYQNDPDLGPEFFDELAESTESAEDKKPAKKRMKGGSVKDALIDDETGEVSELPLEVEEKGAA